MSADKAREDHLTFGPLRQRRFRLKPGQYAHGIEWCRVGEVYDGEISTGRPDVVLVLAPKASDQPGSVELPLAWFEEVSS